MSLAALGAPRSHQGFTRSLVAVGVLALAVGLLVFARTPIVVSGDDSMYVILARSLATGQGYRFLNLPGAPAATHFPPGYPALLALLWQVAPAFPGNLLVFKAFNAVCLAVASVAVAQLTRHGTGSDRWSIAAGALTAVSVPLLVLGNLVLSELFFLAILLPLLIALERLAAAPASSRDSMRHAVVLGAAIGLAVLVRTHAIVLVPAAVLVLARRHRWRDASLLAVAALCCVLPWQLWSARHAGMLPAPLLGQYDSYLGWWLRGYRELGARMMSMTLQRTLGETLSMLAILFSPARSVGARVVTLLAVASLACTGVISLRHRLPVTLLFVAGYLAIVALWPFPPSRFLWGIWPLLLLPLVAGARQAASAAGGERRHVDVRRGVALAGVVAAAWVATGYATYEARAVRGRWWNSIPRANAARIVPAVRWTLANTAPTDVVATDDDGALFLYTGRPSVPVRTFSVQQYLTTLTPRMDAEQGLLPLLAAYPVRAVVVASATTFAAADWAASQPAPLVSIRDHFAGGAAFTVLPR